MSDAETGDGRPPIAAAGAVPGTAATGATTPLPAPTTTTMPSGQPTLPPPDVADRPAVAFDPDAVDRPAPPPPRDPTPLDRRWVLAAAAAAVMADLALRRAPLTNVAGALLIAVLAIGLVGSGFLVSPGSRLLAAGAAFFGVFLAIRTEPILLALDLVAAVGLLVLAAVHGRGRRSFWDLRPLRLAADGMAVIAQSLDSMVEVPTEVSARWRVARERATAGENQTGWAVMRGLAITVPIVAVLGLLLASADVVFQSFFDDFGLFDLPAAIGHLILAAVGAFVMIVLLRLANEQGSSSVARSGRTLGAIETAVLLISVNVLFAAFAVAQVLTIVGGAEAALERAGVDPKEFARQGFFQLLWVAGLTLGLLMTVHVLTAESVKARRLTRLLSPVTVLLTILIVAVAFTRIRFYIEDGGLTPLRLYSSVFAIWVAVAFAITAVRVAGIRPTRDWLLPVLLLSGLGTLGALNLASPERIIAAENLGRSDSAIVYHVEAGQLNGEGQAILAAGIDRLDPEVADRITVELCRGHVGRTTTSDGWLSTNLGQRRGQQALDRLCQ